MDVIGGLLGGLGMFLLAVGMITDGLRLAAGEALRDLLGHWTRTPLHGIGAGALITGIVQSSSAVTVATIGFVNANLLTMHQALGVVYGANIGTTMTGWLVAAVGFQFKIELFALPMIGLGMILRLTGANTRRGALGAALAGFGLFFIGIDVLRGAFEGLAQNFDLGAIDAGSIFGLLLFVGAGILMTVLTQSSSAAIAITLTAASGGVVSFPAAAALVIGANVGTTSTALLAAIGATPNARRVASAHVIFNLATGLVALLLLPAMLWLVANAGRVLDTEGAPAVSLALFHTLFNLLGVLLMWPVTARLAAFLERRFVTAAEDLARPRFLDATTSRTPLLAQDAVRLELGRISLLVRDMACEALHRPAQAAAITSRLQAVYSLADRVDLAVARIERVNLAEQELQELPGLLRLSRRLREAAGCVGRIVSGDLNIAPAEDFLRQTRELLGHWKDLDQPYPDGLSRQARALRDAYAQARQSILAATAAGQFSPERANRQLDALRDVHRMTEQLVKAAQRLHKSTAPAKAGLPEPPKEASSPAT